MDYSMPWQRLNLWIAAKIQLIGEPYDSLGNSCKEKALEISVIGFMFLLWLK